MSQEFNEKLLAFCCVTFELYRFCFCLDFVGCHLNTKKIFVSEKSRLAVTSAGGALFLILYEPTRVIELHNYIRVWVASLTYICHQLQMIMMTMTMMAQMCRWTYFMDYMMLIVIRLKALCRRLCIEAYSALVETWMSKKWLSNVSVPLYQIDIMT